jgi:hypothetical protein
MNRLVLIGDSHVQFLGSHIARNSLPISVRHCNGAKLFEPFAAASGKGTIVWTDAVAEHFGAALENQSGLLVGVSSGAALSIIARDPMWQLHAPWGIADVQSLQPISDSVLRKVINDLMAPTFAFLDLLLAEGFETFFIEPPPLKNTHPGLLSGTKPAVLLAFEEFWRAMTRKECVTRNIRWLEPPSISIDGDGFLKEEYSFDLDKDPHHANAAYSALVVARLIEFAGIEVAERAGH